MNCVIKDWQGKEAGKASLDLKVAKETSAADLIHRAVVRQLANARQGTASTLTRSEVRGGGRKPLKETTFKGVANGAAAGTYTLDKPWLRGQKAEQAKVSKFQQLAGSLDSKEGRGGGAGIFFLGGSRSRTSK